MNPWHVEVAAALAALIAFVALGVGTREGRAPLDYRVWRFFHGHEEQARGSFLDDVANTMLGSHARLAAMAVGLAVVVALLVMTRVRDAAFVVVTTALVACATAVAKEEFERRGLKYSFPSGHAAISAAAVGAFVLVTWSTPWGWLVLLAGAAATMALGAALVYEDWHLPSDVVGGWCLAVGGAAVVHVTWNRRR